MGILEQLFARKHAPEEKRNINEVLTSIGWGGGTWSGASVTPDSAMTNTAVLACVRILSETLASLPLITYERMRPRGKQRAVNFYLYGLLHDAPNPVMTSMEFREALQGHLALWGNAYSEIETDARGRIANLWPLRPDKMREIKKIDDRLYYHYQLPSGELRWMSGENIWHLRGMAADGIVGYSPISLARQAVALALATEEYGSRFFGNGARPGGVLMYPGQLSDQAYDKLRKQWDAQQGGLSNAQRTAILEEGLTYQAIGVPPEDAQFLETRKFQLSEIARIFRVPPHMLADLDRATFSNIEHQSLEFVVHTMRPWLVRWEQSISQKLMLPNERARYFSEFLVDGLLRGDIQSRYAAYATGRQNGWLSADDIREMENQNPIGEAEGGNLYLVPLNMIPANQAAQPVMSQEPAPQPNGQRSLPAVDIETRGKQAAALRLRLQQRYTGLYADVAGRVVRREANDIANNAKKHFGQRSAATFSEWLAAFYEGHGSFVRDAFAPLTTNYAGQVADLAAAEVGQDAPDVGNFVTAYIDSMAVRHVAKQEARLRTVMENAPEDPLPAILAELETWREKKPAEIGLGESVRANNAVALAVYGMAGITRKVWRTMGKNCPYCQQLDGKTIALELNFISAGQPLTAEGKTPLIPSRDVGHAPAHGGCDCMIVAG